MGPKVDRPFYFVNEKPIFALSIRNCRTAERNVKLVVDFRLGGFEGTRFPIIIPLHLGPSASFNMNLEGPPLASEGLATYRLVQGVAPDDAYNVDSVVLQKRSGDDPFSMLCEFKVVDREYYEYERRLARRQWLVLVIVTSIAAVTAIVALVLGR